MIDDDFDCIPIDGVHGHLFWNEDILRIEGRVIRPEKAEAARMDTQQAGNRFDLGLFPDVASRCKFNMALIRKGIQNLAQNCLVLRRESETHHQLIGRLGACSSCRS